MACKICGKGELSRDFICDKCGHPEKIILYCNNCHQETEMEEAYLDHLRNELGIPVPKDRRKGIVVVISSCHKCSEIVANPEIKVYGLR